MCRHTIYPVARMLPGPRRPSPFRPYFARPRTLFNSPSILRQSRRWNANVLKACDLPSHDAVSGTCDHLPAKGLRICTWNTRGLLGSAASSQRPRENKLKYLKRIGNRSDIVCLQETHGRYEHLLCIDTVLDRTAWEIFGTFNTGNVNCGGSAILVRKDILGPGTSFKHEDIFPGRDHLVRIRQLDCNCTVTNLHHQSGGTLQELRQRLRAAASRWPT